MRQADDPTSRACSRAPTTAAARDRSAAIAAHDVTVLQIPFSSPLSPARLRSGLSLLRLPLPVGGVPGAAREPVQRRLHRRARQRDDWTTSGSGRRSRRPTTSRRSPIGQPLTIKSTGLAAMSPAEAAGTPYGGGHRACCARRSRCRTRRTAHSLCLSIFDHGDARCDSAVFIDNLTLTPAARRSLPRGRDLARPGRRDHRPDRRRHRRHADADAHRHGRQRAGRRGRR